MGDLTLSRLCLDTRRQAEAALLAVNPVSARYGLVLTREAAAALTEKCQQSMAENGRVEFGESILPKLAFTFCDSPYIQQEDYAEILSQLLDAFCYFKTDSLELATDDELLLFMRERFDKSGGSMDELTNTALEELCHCLRFGETGERYEK